MAWYDAPLNIAKSVGSTPFNLVNSLLPGSQANKSLMGGDFGALTGPVMPIGGSSSQWQNTVRPPALSMAPPGGAGGDNPLDLGNFAQDLLRSEPSFAPGISPEWMSFLDAGTKAQMAPLEAILAAGQGQISQREAAAKGLLGQMPGDLQGIKQQGTEGIMNMASLFGQQGEHFSPFELGESGMHPMMGTAPGLAGLESLTANRLQGLPYLDMANQQWAGQQQTALQMAHQDAIRQAEQDKFRAMTDIGMQQMGIDADWRKAQLGALGQGGAFDSGVGGGQYGPLSVAADRGWEILHGKHGEGRAEKLRALSGGKAWQEGEQLLMDTVASGGDLQQALDTWTLSGDTDAAKRNRAEIASILMAQSGFYAGPG